MRIIERNGLQFDNITREDGANIWHVYDMDDYNTSMIGELKCTDERVDVVNFNGSMEVLSKLHYAFSPELVTI